MGWCLAFGLAERCELRQLAVRGRGKDECLMPKE